MENDNLRERLIEIIEDAHLEAIGTLGSMNQGPGVWYADHLIKAGVIICPVPIGSYVYEILYLDKKRTQASYNRRKVVGMHLYDTLNRRGVRRGQYLVLRSDSGYSAHVNINQIGETIFTSEEAVRMKIKEVTQRHED